jgi:hypothetical protein
MADGAVYTPVVASMVPLQCGHDHVTPPPSATLAVNVIVCPAVATGGAAGVTVTWADAEAPPTKIKKSTAPRMDLVGVGILVIIQFLVRSKSNIRRAEAC